MTHEVAPAARPKTVANRWITMAHAIFFVLGFSLIFVVGWGGAATVLGQLFRAYKTEIAQIGGIVIILFGLATMGLLRIPWLHYDTRPQWQGGQSTNLMSSTLMGVFFAAGWTPCIGTTLGAILTLGFSEGSAGQAMLLTSGYALGLGLPFLLIGFGLERALRFIGRFRRHLRKFQLASGLLLIVIGFMLLTNQMTVIAIWAQQNGLYLDLPLGTASTPTYLVAILAGLLSFLSPCVLPLVPAYVGYLSGRSLADA
ncbi:MAG: cytochrome C biogenesis protein [Anaerolineaceae bacterium]|nr:cytochrome C biogenesis protein [Anaerolineaceae bacterium]